MHELAQEKTEEHLSTLPHLLKCRLTVLHEWLNNALEKVLSKEVGYRFLAVNSQLAFVIRNQSLHP